MLYLIQFLYYAIPVAAVAFFVVSLCRFLSARKRNRIQPGSVSPKEMNTLKWMLIVSAVIAGIVIAFMFLLFMAVAFM